MHIGQLNNFLHAVRQHGWDDTLPATALLFTDDYPKRAERPPRALAEQVMAQVEHPDNLARWDNPGPPAGHADPDPLPDCGSPTRCALPHDCIVARRRGRPLPALLQPQDETRGAGPDRRATPPG